MKEKTIFKSAIFLILLVANFLFCGFAYAAGNVSGNAWSDQEGFFNFGCDNCDATVDTTSVTGYGWSANFGWINLNPDQGGVKNDGNGNLSGTAWSSSKGWMDFSAVKINTSSGLFTGEAVGANGNTAILNFDCLDCSVTTTWRPPAASTTVAKSTGGSLPPPSLLVVPTPPTQPSEITPLPIVALNIILEKIKSGLEALIPKAPKPEVSQPTPVVTVPMVPPLALNNKWNVFPVSPISNFVLAPLPPDISILAQKFPQLAETFKNLGISKITDVEKLKTGNFVLPTLAEVTNLSEPIIGANKVSQPQSIPINDLTLQQRNQIPTEIVFAKTGNGLIDYNIFLSVNSKNETQQRIDTVTGKPMQLIIKPDGSAKSVIGYIVFVSNPAKGVSFQIPLSSLTASLVLPNPDLAQNAGTVSIDRKLVLSEFEYVDEKNDGIYTANVKAPTVEGNYQIITVINYKDIKAGTKVINLTTVVDPEGYIYTKSAGLEARVAGAVISIYWLNPSTDKYELWPSKQYQQENPQVTDSRGTYSFLVPPGFYYIDVQTPGYIPHNGKPFQVSDSNGVHLNIELKTQFWWIQIFNWQTILLIVLVLLLIFHFYRDKIREKILLSKNK